MMDYPSTKRMKKRKELDALVADKKKTLLKSSPGSSLPDRLLKSSLIKPMMIKTRGDHQLLRSQDSESENEFVAFNKNEHSTASAALVGTNGSGGGITSQKRPFYHHQKQVQKTPPSRQRQQLRSEDDDADDVDSYAFHQGDDTDLEAASRRRGGCCSESPSSSSSHKQRPYPCCSRCCHLALMFLCVFGLIVLTWMHLGMKREMQTIESRLLRLSIGFTARPPKRLIDDIVLDNLLPVNRTVESLQDNLESLRLSVVELNKRFNHRPTTTQSTSEWRQIVDLRNEFSNLKRDSVSMKENLQEIKVRIVQDEEKMGRMMTTTTASPTLATENSGRVFGLEARMGEIESSLMDLKRKMEDWMRIRKVEEKSEVVEEESSEEMSGRLVKEENDIHGKLAATVTNAPMTE